MNQTPKKQILIGLPESGKSTFIGALWHVVESEEIAESLKLHLLGDDDEYVESLREAWLTQEKPERNKIEERHLVWMQLKEPSTGSVAELVFPDLAGELFEEQWDERVWPSDYGDLLAEAGGILLFVHADHPHMPRHLSDISEEARTSGTALEQGSFDLGQCPAQVKLVEILQFITEHSLRDWPMPIAVIVSAWDLIEEMPKVLGKPTPEDFLAKQVPLLNQYLRANPDYFFFRVFGVSAQGGDLKRHREKLQHVAKQSERIIIRSGEDMTSDITFPIRWLMGKSSK